MTAQKPEGCLLTVATALKRMPCARLNGALKRANTTPSMHMSRSDAQMTWDREELQAGEPRPKVQIVVLGRKQNDCS